jgi:predicted DNA-binding transcriptional regulator YafY
MSSSDRETLLRQWQMMRLIPGHPFKITARELFQKLAEHNHVITKRTVERDLKALARHLPLVCDDSEKPYGWSWGKDTGSYMLPVMSGTEAMAINLLGDYAKPVLGATALPHLQRLFAAADEQLAHAPQEASANWQSKLHVSHAAQAHTASGSDSEVQAVVTEGLLQDKMLAVGYQKPGEQQVEQYRVHPLALVHRAQLTYLVCLLSEIEETRALALHRIRSVQVLDVPSQRPENFSLDSFIASGKLGFGDEKTIRLEALFTPSAFRKVYETPLSNEQKWSPNEDGRLKLTAIVKETEQLRGWLMGFGGEVEVILPLQLRKTIAQAAREMVKVYYGYSTWQNFNWPSVDK